MTARIKSEPRAFIIPTTYENSPPNVAVYDRSNQDCAVIVRTYISRLSTRSLGCVVRGADDRFHSTACAELSDNFGPDRRASRNDILKDAI